MTLFAFLGVKSHEWTFYDPIIVAALDGLMLSIAKPVRLKKGLADVPPAVDRRNCIRFTEK